MALTFGSLFAGIGGFDGGFEEAGMQCLWQVEIDPQARRVLGKHWPAVERHDDVRECGKRNLARVDVVCGGFPCQDLSIAGRGEGIKADRSGLFYQMTRIVDELQPAVCIFENVPGLLSNDGGRSAALVLWEFARLRLHGGWRVLDSQYFGVAQRRDRVFGVFARGRSGARRAAEILALTEGCGRNPAASREAKQAVAAALRSRSHSPGVSAPGCGGEDDSNLVVAFGNNRTGGAQDLVAVTGKNRQDFETEMLVVAFAQNQRAEVREMDKAGALASQPGVQQQTFVLQGHHPRNCPDDPLVFQTRIGRNGRGQPKPIVDALTSSEGGTHADSKPRIFSEEHGVRRLMPVECLRLQGFPDDWLDLYPPLSDSAKYRLIGNAVTKTVAAWLGCRVVSALA